MTFASLKKHMQLKIIALIFIVFLLSIVVFFVSTYLRSDDKHEQEEWRITEMTRTILLLNNLQCTSEMYQDYLCADYLKLNNFSSTPHAEYFDLLNFSTVKIKYITSDGVTNEKIIYKKDNQNKLLFFTPFLVRNQDLKENYYGIIEVYR